jgi:hypothetical protein
MVEAIQSRRADGVRVGVVAVEGVIFLVNFLKLMLGDKPSKSINRSFSVGEVGGRAIYGVFSEVEVTHEDGIDCMVVVSERVKFSKPEHAVRAMKVDVDKTESFTC